MTNPFENPNFIPKPERPTEPQRPVGGSAERALESSEKSVNSRIEECEENIRHYKNMNDMDMVMKETKKLRKWKERFKEDKKSIERADVIM